MLIDTHVHLDDSRLQGDVAAVVERAHAAGVQRMVCIATTAASSERCIALAQRFEQVYASVGIHPNNAHEAAPGDWQQIERLAGSAKVVALGETGLDRYWKDAPFPLQQDYFRRHLQLSRSTKLPVVIHCRDAEADILPMLEADYAAHGPLRGIMHSFCGNQAFADACLRLGLYLSFSGMLTYKKNDELRQIAASVPADRILVETDAPYLTPEPVRGKTKRNEPAYTVHTAECLAVARSMGLDELWQETTRNACGLLGLSGIGS